MARNDAKLCQWGSLREALTAFVCAPGGTQSSAHIKPLHWYVACRLVLEGGIHPDDITPRPPFDVVEGCRDALGRPVLMHDSARAGSGELAVLGGLKTKDVDVVVCKPGIGPCIAISMKGMRNALRNLTNRMEEAIGDCTNLHIAYPTLVYGFLHVLRANREGPVPASGASIIEPDENGNVKANDVALRSDGQPTDSVTRYHDVLTRLAGRAGMREDPTRYEAVALALISADDDSVGAVLDAYPPVDSPLRLDDFFERIYRQYDQRFVYSAPALSATTARLEWNPNSPALADARVTGYMPRTSA